MPLYRPPAPAGQWEESELWRILHDIASALAYLHAQSPPITHNDIKPEQFLQNDDGAYILADFGISGHLLEEVSRDMSPTMHPAYLPPESMQKVFLPQSGHRCVCLRRKPVLLSYRRPARPARRKYDFPKLRSARRGSRAPARAVLQYAE
jgi:serine/threonine protein kinase